MLSTSTASFVNSLRRVPLFASRPYLILPDGRDSSRQGRTRLGKVRKCGYEWSEDDVANGGAER